MKPPAPLMPIRSRVAHGGYEDSRFAGYSVYRDLFPGETPLSLLALSVLGRRLSDSEKSLLDEICAVLSEGDPRIWPLKVTHLVSSYGGELAGVAAGSLSIYRAKVGPWVSTGSAQMLVEVAERIEPLGDDEATIDAAIADYLSLKKRYSGFGVPMRPVDLRYVGMCQSAARHGLDRGRHFLAMQKLVAHVEAHKPELRPNGTLSSAALLLDFGFDPRGVGAMLCLMHMPMFFANAFEAAFVRADTLRCLPDDRVQYLGPPPRHSPRMNKIQKNNVHAYGVPNG